MRERLAAQAYALGWAVVKALPEPVARVAFDAIADVMWWRRGTGVQRLEANLARVLGAEVTPGKLRNVSRAGMRSYLRYWREAFRLPTQRPEAVVSRLHTENEHLLRDGLAEGRGVVTALPHSGNWDHAGAWVVLTGVDFSTVVERLRPESLYDRFVAYREGLGMEVLSLTGGAGDVYAALLARLRTGGLVCLLADRDIRASGVEVDFFGETARMPAGPASLALDTGAPLLPVSLWYSDQGTHVRFHPAVHAGEAGTRAEQVRAMTQQVADAFAEGIRAHPQDWHMLQRLWVADVPARRSAGV